MGKEWIHVVKPLLLYFKNNRSSNVNWEEKENPPREKGATGWDLQMERKNLVLLIEAKYLSGPFISCISGLLVAPLSCRPERTRSGIYRDWSASVCWAIGIGGDWCWERFFYNLFDYMCRNPQFWKAYARTLSVKYVYFVERPHVEKIGFNALLDLAEQYGKEIRNETERRIKGKVAKKLTGEKFRELYKPRHHS